MTAIGGFRSDLSITRKTDRHVGNVSAGVLFSNGGNNGPLQVHIVLFSVISSS